MLACILSCFTFQPPTGISSETILKHSDISEEELLDLIFKLNTDPRVDGLLVQLPLPGIEREIDNEYTESCICRVAVIIYLIIKCRTPAVCVLE